MIDDLNILRAMVRETQGRVSGLRTEAQDAQQKQYQDGNLRETGAAWSLERFLLAMDDAERARRRLRAAEEAAMNEGAA